MSRLARRGAVGHSISPLGAEARAVGAAPGHEDRQSDACVSGADKGCLLRSTPAVLQPLTRERHVRFQGETSDCFGCRLFTSFPKQQRQRHKIDHMIIFALQITD